MKLTTHLISELETMDQHIQPQPTYSENLLYHAGFEFQPRTGERLNLRRISTVDIPAIIRDVDTELLSSYLEEITFCEITVDDLHLYSDDTFVLLFQVAQLMIEFLVDNQDNLSANLNGLAKKYAAKKREIESLSKNLAKADAEVATLKDELYYNNKCMRASMSSKSSAMTAPASRVDPSLYPSQERRPTSSVAPATLEEISSKSSDGDAGTNGSNISKVSGKASHPYYDDDSSSDDEEETRQRLRTKLKENAASKSSSSSQEDGIIKLHIISSAHGLYLHMDVEDSLTVKNLKNKIVSRLLIARDFAVDFGLHSLYYKDEELNDSSKTLKDYQVVSDAALVLTSSLSSTTMATMQRPAEKVKEAPDYTSNMPSAVKEKASDETPKEEPKLEETSKIESKLEELTSIAQKSQEELIQATRALQFQCELSKEIFAKEIGKQLKSFDESLREEVQRQVQDAIMEHGQKQDDAQKHKRNLSSPLSKLNVGELVESDSDQDDENEEECEKNGDSVSKKVTVSDGDETKEPSDGVDENQVKVAVPLKVDTNLTAEVLDHNPSPFNPPSSIEVSDMTEDTPQEEVMKGAVVENETLSSSTMRYSASSTRDRSPNSTIDAEIEDRTPTPSKGHLDRKVPPEDLVPATLSPSHWNGTAVPSTRMNHMEDRQFRFSDDSVQGIANIIDFPDDYDNDSVSGTALMITTARRPNTMDSSLQSVFMPNDAQIEDVYAEDQAGGKPDGNKKGRFGYLKKGKKERMSIKKMMPKWNKKLKKETETDIVEI